MLWDRSPRTRNEEFPGLLDYQSEGLAYLSS